MSNNIESLDLSSESSAYQFSSQENHQNGLTIDAVSYALQGVIQQLKYYSALSTASSQLEEIYNLKESEKLSGLLASWASGILVNQPSISLLDDAFLQGAKGAYAAENNHIYVAKSLTDRDSLTGLNQVLLEEYGHALDVYFNADKDTLGDEGEWFSLVVSGVSLTRQDVLRLQGEKDLSTLWVDNHSVTVEQSTTSLDFNSDQNLDILWRDPASGQNVVWFMGGTNNTQQISGASLTTVGGGWSIKGVSDFNGDNRPDLLWRDPVSGQNVVWFMGGSNNTQQIGGASLTTVGGSWDIKGISDFNGDNRPDLLWRDPVSGQNVVWFMGGSNNTQQIGGASLTTVGGSWDIKGISDFNGDSRPDLLWRDPVSGQNVVWFMGGTNNTQQIGGTSLTTVGGSWDIKGISDFNGDSRPDLLWRDPVSGQNVVWFMGGTNNTQPIGSASLTTVGGGWAPILASWTPKTQPDLVVTNQYAPTSANVGDSITVSAYTKNQEIGTAGYSYVRYLLSNDTIVSNDDTFLGSNYVGALTAGSSEYDSFTFTYGSGWGTGSKYILFQADGYSNVSESNEGNNVAYQAITINPLSQPDLVVTNLSAPISITVGDSIPLSYYIKNQGTAAAGSSSVSYWLSSDTVLSSDDYLLRSQTIGSIDAGSSVYDSAGLVYSSTLGTGQKYILIDADGYRQVTESNENNNIAYQAITIYPPLPDLTIVTPSAPTSATAGNSITVSTYTKNQGTVASSSNYVHYWLSDDSTLITSSDRYLGNSYVDSLTAGSSEYNTFTFTYNASWGTGTKYILFQSDGYNQVTESNESNNVVYKAITINSPTLPDLIITNQYVPTLATVGDSITVSAYTKNQGTGTASSHSLRYYLSNDTTLSSDDYDLGYDSVASLTAGSSEYDSLTFIYSSSWGAGTKYILFQADGYSNVSESNEGNNVVSQAITINQPSSIDLTGTYFYNNESILKAGNGYNFNFGIKNFGTSIAGTFQVGFYISKDTLVDTSDYFLGSHSVSSLGVGVSTDLSKYLILPSAINSFWNGQGTYYVGMIVDYQNSVDETNESNNTYHDSSVISSFNIEFDYTYDSSGWFDSSKRAALEAAADIWERVILDEFVNTPTGTNTPYVRNPQTDQYLGIDNIYTTTSVIDDLKIFVGSRSSVSTSGTALAQAGASGNYVNETRYTGSDFEPWLGFLTFNTSYSWFLDSTPEDSTVPFNQYDFVSVAVHEIGHVLGISSGIDAFSNWVYNSAFTGTNAKYYNGGNAVPLASSSPSHIQDGYTYGSYGENAMDPTISNGKRKLPTLLDIAILDDIGYHVNYGAAYYNT